jgi:hypothetical protein
MWILPRQLHTSPFVPDTEALISDSAEQSEICAQSLLARSKPSPARTWSQRWKRDSWTAHLSGRILKPSHGPSFVTAWTSSLAATRASRSAQPASDSAPKTLDTSGRLSQPELLQCDLVPAFLKTSTDISRWGFPTCCKTWQDWVTERRGAWRQRVNAARLTRGSASSSWPTIRASEYKDVGPVGSKSHDHMLGKHYLCAVVTQEESNGQAAPVNWSTPNTLDTMPPKSMEGIQRVLTHDGRKNRKSTGNLREDVVMFGQAAPASSSSHGSRQGLWLTPRANEPDSDPNFAARNADRGAHCHGTLSSQAKETWWTPQVQDSKHSGTNPTANGERDLLVNQVNCMTPRACEAQNPPMGVDKRHHGLTHQVKHGWLTPKVPSGGSQSQRTTPGGGLRKLEDQTEKATGKLNPRWVETLMGLPIGWTMPSCIRPVTIALTSCDYLETALCRPAQSGPSDFLLASWPSPRAGESQQTDELSRLWVECGYKQPKTRGGKPRANNSTYDVTLETAVRGVAKAETTT